MTDDLRTPARIVLVLALIALVAQFLVLRGTVVFNDEASYFALAQGLRDGCYSQWTELGACYPDTFRSPGYPMFIALLGWFDGTREVVQWAQLSLALLSVLIVFRLLEVRRGPRVAGAFGVLVALSPQLAYFSAAVAPEVLMMFLVTAWVHSALGQRALLSGFLGGLMALVRPTALLFPVFHLVLVAWRRRAVPRSELFAALVALLAVAPYGLWNQRSHGVFSLTPIEGGGPNAHDGLWQLHLPGYTSFRYWNGSQMGVEPFSFLLSPADRAQNAALYEKDWDRIDNEAPMGAEDLRRRAMMAGRPLFPTYTTDYVRRRAGAIERSVLRGIRADPGTYIATRLYTAIRLWVPAPVSRDLNATSLRRLLRATVPTALLGVVFGGGALLILLRVRADPTVLCGLLPLVSISLYWWLIHVPFSIQARYTLPVHLLALGLIAAALAFTSPSRSRS